MFLQRCKNIRQFCRLMHYKVSPKQVGVSLLKTHEKNEDECNYPSIQKFNVQTKDRRHSFEVPCDNVLQYIHLGAINKQMATQYCHYLAELTRVADQPEDIAYYASRCIELISYLLKSDKDIPLMTQNKLVSDCADTTRENCLAISSKWRLNHAARATDFSQLLGACYRFGHWEEADRILLEAPSKLVTFRISDHFTEGVVNASKEYKSLSETTQDRTLLRLRVINSMSKLCRQFSLTRTQMITKRKSEFIQALMDLGLRVRINPSIKMTGRCTACETHLPLFDPKLVANINASIRSQLIKGAEKGIYLNTSPNDVHRFEEFLRQLYEKDKKPIDCVIDGLNIAYRSISGYDVFQKNIGDDVTRTYKVPQQDHQAQVLINSIIRGDMLTRFRKILVVGKWHMTKWPGLLDFFKKHNIHFYASYNNTKDDLFQLLAATLNPKTTFVTNDFLRDHLAQLEEDDRTLLERWIDTHQAWVSQRTLKPTWPTAFEKIACSDQNGTIFHLPLIDFHQLDKVGVTEPPPHLNFKILTWVCCELKE